MISQPNTKIYTYHRANVINDPHMGKQSKVHIYLFKIVMKYT